MLKVVNYMHHYYLFDKLLYFNCCKYVVIINIFLKIATKHYRLCYTVKSIGGVDGNTGQSNIGRRLA